jgi:hypothetical protein
LRELRIALFYLQRLYRDSWDNPDPAFVAALVSAIRERIAKRKLN